MAESETIKERLILFIRYLNIGQGKFEARCGLANGYVNNIRRSITPEKLQQIARQYPELNAGWLMTGEGEMLKTETVNIGEVSGGANTIGMSVNQSISKNSGQNAGRDLINHRDKSLLEELAAQRHLAERQLEVYSDSLSNKDDQIRTAQSQIDTLIKQNQEQFNRFMSLIQNLQSHWHNQQIPALKATAAQIINVMPKQNAKLWPNKFCSE